MDPALSPLLARIDDRLIHGQVVVGCCEPLGAERILLIDDDVAADSLQQKLYRAGVPPEVQVRFVAVADAGSELGGAGPLASTVVVVARAKTMASLLELGVAFRCVQLGGAHARVGSTELVPGFFLDAADRDALRQLLESGTEVVIQPLSSSAVTPLVLSMLGESR